MKKVLYDIEQSFLYNVHHGPFFDEKIIPFDRILPKYELFSLFDYQIYSPIGVPACIITTSKGIKLLSQLGFDVLTYKTIRSKNFIGHALPNICYLKGEIQLSKYQCGSFIQQAKKLPTNLKYIAISNSFGKVCPDFDWIQQDIQKARTYIQNGQVLIVSVFGTGENETQLIKDFTQTAYSAYEAGAQIIEINLSCPNINNSLTLYIETDLIFHIISSITKALPIPVITKLGIFMDTKDMHKTLIAIAQAGAQGVCGINSIAMQVIDPFGKPVFGPKRTLSGISGNPIRNLALDFIRTAQKINQKERLDLTILGTGGITLPEHFDDFLQAGADVAMSATGTMWNPYLAHEYHCSNSAQVENQKEVYNQL